MWLFCKIGVFSVVESVGSDELVIVRSRDRGDMERFCNAVHVDACTVVFTPSRDYRWRVFVPKSVWAAFASEQAERIDYGNFKDCIKSKFRDVDRDRMMHDVWGAMWRFQDVKERKSKGEPRGTRQSRNR